jgi:LacI family transcriptional regulator
MALDDRTQLCRVSLLFPQRPGPWPDIVSGVYRYANTQAVRHRWLISLHTEEDASVALAGNPDGVVAMVRTKDIAAKLSAWGKPVVDTAYDLDGLPFAQVGFDARAIGRVAAEHLLQLKRRIFAYVGDSTPAGRLERQGFVERLHKAGVAAIVAPSGFDCPYREEAQAERAATAWVASLPRPAAIFAAHDALAHRLAQACQVAGLRVPQDIALLGCLNDEFLCNASQPPLSSVSVPVPALGYEAARLLDSLMAGTTQPQRLELPPLGVVTRQSTDPAAVADPELATALRFIRTHATERIRVEDIASATELSRSSLERRFRAVLGRGPLAELLRERVDRAKHLLAETDLTVKEVARLVGFHDTRHLSVTFRQKVGVGPAAFRLRFRPG